MFLVQGMLIDNLIFIIVLSFSILLLVDLNFKSLNPLVKVTGDATVSNSATTTLMMNQKNALERLKNTQKKIQQLIDRYANASRDLRNSHDKRREEQYKKRNEHIRLHHPNFWHTIFLSHRFIADHMTEQDRMIMKHLTSLKVDEEDLDYSITFNFSSNPFFENETIIKSYKFKHGKVESTSTKIDWKAGKVMLQEVNHRKKGNARKTDASVLSFFNWFDTSEEFDGFDRIAMLIKVHIWPNPLKFFNGTEPLKQEDEVWNLWYSDDDDEDNKAFQLEYSEEQEYSEDEKASDMEDSDADKADSGDDKTSAMEDSDDEEDTDDDITSDMVNMEILYGIQEHLKQIDDDETSSIFWERETLSNDVQQLYFERNEYIKLIPNFWLTVFQKHPVLAGLINDEDIKIFEHLTSIEVGDPHDIVGQFLIVFTFKRNPYLKTTEIRKQLTTSGKTIATYRIDWHAGAGSNVRFFKWFQDPNDIDDATNQVARVIKYKLWPDPLKYYCSSLPSMI